MGQRATLPIAEKALEIGCRRAQQARVVVEVSDPQVALAAEQPAHLAGHVAMIDAKPLRGSLPADGAGAPLSRQKAVIVLDRQPVVVF
jgi:hypothetical protein